MEHPRAVTNPLYGPNRLKLGVFGSNLGGGCSATLAEGTLEASWPATREIAILADQAGIEALVPVARWRGFGGRTDFNARCFETYTWAAGLAAQTERIAVFATSHVRPCTRSWRPSRPRPSITSRVAASR